MLSPHEILGVPENATVTQVRAAWRLKVAECGVHPDKGGATEPFSVLREAYHRALKIAENLPCLACNGTGKVGTGHGAFVQTFLRCAACGGSGKRREKS